MMPVPFKGQTAIMDAPPGDPDVIAIPIQLTDQGVESVWELTDEELTRILVSKRIRLICGTRPEFFYPVALAVEP